MKALIYLSFTLLLSLLLVGCGNGSNSDQPSDNTGNCNGGEYVNGVIIVGFNEGVTEEQADQLISSYNLKWAVLIQEPELFVTVNVTEGTEQQWIETFENEQIVSSAELDCIVSITGGN
jgi:hypothetical protein